jgi:hypothetical protein
MFLDTRPEKRLRTNFILGMIFALSILFIRNMTLTIVVTMILALLLNACELWRYKVIHKWSLISTQLGSLFIIFLYGGLVELIGYPITP